MSIIKIGGKRIDLQTTVEKACTCPSCHNPEWWKKHGAKSARMEFHEPDIAECLWCGDMFRIIVDPDPKKNLCHLEKL